MKNLKAIPHLPLVEGQRYEESSWRRFNGSNRATLGECHPHQIIFKLMINIYKSVLLYRKHIWIIVRRRNEDYEFRGPGPKPIVHRPSHLHNGSHLRPRTVPVVRFVHVLCCVAFLSTLLSFSLSRYTTVCLARCIHLALTLVVDNERGGVASSLAQRWASSFDISRYCFSRATASCLCEPKLDSIPNLDCFLLTRLNCPNECNRLCRCLTYILDPRSVR